VDEDAQRRLAANEKVFRDVNEGIVRGQWPGEAEAPIGFRCECARLGCNVLVGLTLAEYEQVRADGRHFLMLSGHELPEVERVVRRRDHYVIVEKGHEAGKLAEENDPRE
jgi:hypothetical protein